MKKILSLLTLLLSVMAIANDGVYYTSGNQLVPLQETDISVKKEILSISLLDDGTAKVDVYYEFFNPSSKAKTLQMGFEADPSYNDDYEFHSNGVHPHIKNFTVEINGQLMNYKNAVCVLSDKPEFKPADMNKYKVSEEVTHLVNKNNEDEYLGFAYVYYFNATFQPGINKVHHTYSYTLSETVGTLFELSYKLTPATRWANHQIDDFTLFIRADNTAKHFFFGHAPFKGGNLTTSGGQGKLRANQGYDGSSVEASIRNSAVMFHATNYCPKDELSIVSADVFSSFNEDAKLGCFYDRSNASRIIYEMTPRKQKLSDQLRARIIRNLPYAHRGHVFKDKVLKNYFESLWWYMPDPTYKDDTSDFTPADWECINSSKQ